MSRTPTRLSTLAAGLVLTAATAGCGVFGSDDTKTLTANFDRTVGVYEASDVRVLGVRIGEVTSIVPEGDTVRVEMSYEAKYDIPADAQAIVVAPSVVSDRYIQLTPVYTGGPVLASASVLEPERTLVPLELDEIFEQLDSLNLALGPNGANEDGALSDLLSVTADNLDGNGERFNNTLRDVSQFVETLNDQRDDLFGTITNLQEFTTTIANSDGTVRDFNRDIAAVADQLADEREDLATAVTSLSVALGEVATFVDENEEGLTTNVRELAEVTRIFTDNRTALEEFIDTAPGALSNLQLAYNPKGGTLETRDNGPAQAEGMPLILLCVALEQSGNVLPPQLSALPGAEELQQACRDAQNEEGGEGGGPPGLPAPPSGLPLEGPTGVPAPTADALTLGGLLVGAR